jgi:hypothetical protein
VFEMVYGNYSIEQVKMEKFVNGLLLGIAG